MKIITPLSKAEFYRHNNLYNFEVNKQVNPPSPLENLHRQAINTCYTERTKTKREAGKMVC